MPSDAVLRTVLSRTIASDQFGIDSIEEIETGLGSSKITPFDRGTID